MACEEQVIGPCRLIRGDCREVLPLLEPVDIVATDPPYLDLATKQTISTLSLHRGPVHTPARTVGDPWTASLDWVSQAWQAALRALFVWTSYHGVAHLPQQLSPLKPKALITWYQRNNAPSSHNAPHYQTEFCWVFSRPESGLNWRKLPTHLDIPKIQAGCIAHPERLLNTDSTAAHPTQKPISVFTPLLAIGGRSVCDPFMGTGTCGLASMLVGARFVGIEINPRYFDLACQRIEEAYRQLDLTQPATWQPPKQLSLETLYAH